MLVKASDAKVSEFGSSTGAFTFTRVGDLTLGVDVQYAISGTALAGIDHNLGATGAVSFGAGVADVTILVTAVDDRVLENNETVVITIADSKRYTVVGPTATVLIADSGADEPNQCSGGTLQAVDDSSEGEMNAGFIAIDVLSNDIKACTNFVIQSNT